MQTPGKATRVRIYTTEGDRRDGRPLHQAVLGLLRAENAQGATLMDPCSLRGAPFESPRRVKMTLPVVN